MMPDFTEIMFQCFGRNTNPKSAASTYIVNDYTLYSVPSWSPASWLDLSPPVFHLESTVRTLHVLYLCASMVVSFILYHPSQVNQLHNMPKNIRPLSDPLPRLCPHWKFLFSPLPSTIIPSPFWTLLLLTFPYFRLPWTALHSISRFLSFSCSIISLKSLSFSMHLFPHHLFTYFPHLLSFTLFDISSWTTVRILYQCCHLWHFLFEVFCFLP